MTDDEIRDYVRSLTASQRLGVALSFIMIFYRETHGLSEYIILKLVKDNYPEDVYKVAAEKYQQLRQHKSEQSRKTWKTMRRVDA